MVDVEEGMNPFGSAKGGRKWCLLTVTLVWAVEERCVQSNSMENLIVVIDLTSAESTRWWRRMIHRATSQTYRDAIMQTHYSSQLLDDLYIPLQLHSPSAVSWCISSTRGMGAMPAPTPTDSTCTWRRGRSSWSRRRRTLQRTNAYNKLHSITRL